MIRAIPAALVALASFAAILVLSLMGLLLYAAVETLERITIPWHISHRRAETDIAAVT